VGKTDHSLACRNNLAGLRKCFHHHTVGVSDQNRIILGIAGQLGIGFSGRQLGFRIIESRLRLFVTLVRFDAAYHGLFKCNLRRLADYRHLSAFLALMLGVPGIRETVSIDHIKQGYYSIKALNPNGIVPLGPDLPGLAPVNIASKEA